MELEREAKQAIEEDDIEKLAALVKENRSRNADLNVDHLLLHALKLGSPAAVRVLLEGGADPNGLGLVPNELFSIPPKTGGPHIVDKILVLLEYGATLKEIGRFSYSTTHSFVKKMVEEEPEKVSKFLDIYFSSYGGKLPLEWEDALLEASAYQHRWEILEKLRHHGLDLTHRGSYRKTLLHIWAEGFHEFHEQSCRERSSSGYEAYRPASHFNYTQEQLERARRTLEVLISAGLDVNAKDDWGETPLHYLCKLGAKKEVLDLLFQVKANPNEKNLFGENPLFLLPPWATESFEALLNYGTDPRAVNCREISPLTQALRIALWETKSEYIKKAIASFDLLIRNGADPSEKANGSSPFFAEFFKMFLKDVISGKIPREDFYGLLENAFRHGSDPNTLYDGGTSLLHYASWIGDVQTVRFLLQKGADPNLTGPDGETPAHKAATSPNAFEVLTELKKAGANLNARDKYGISVAYLCVRNEHLNTSKIKHLALMGMDFKEETLLLDMVKQWEYHRRSPEVQAEKFSLVRFLVQEIGIPLDAKDSKGDTLLHLACKKGNKELAQLLVDLGAKVWEKNAEGKTPGDFLVRKTSAKSATKSSPMPFWAVKLGLLPLKNEKALLEILENEFRVRRGLEGIKRFFEGIIRNEPLVFMDLMSRLPLPQLNGIVGSVIKESFAGALSTSTSPNKNELGLDF